MKLIERLKRLRPKAKVKRVPVTWFTIRDYWQDLDFYGESQVQQSSSFFRLPQELRDQVYGELLENEPLVFFWKLKGPRGDAYYALTADGSVVPLLARICKQLRQELTNTIGTPYPWAEETTDLVTDTMARGHVDMTLRLIENESSFRHIVRRVFRRPAPSQEFSVQIARLQQGNGFLISMEFGDDKSVRDVVNLIQLYVQNMVQLFGSWRLGEQGFFGWLAAYMRNSLEYPPLINSEQRVAVLNVRVVG